jgi:hypothetical protein
LPLNGATGVSLISEEPVARRHSLPPQEEFGEDDPRGAVLSQRRTPYVGLLPFQDADRHFFFGRDRHVDELLKRIARQDQHFVAIVGESGCGKSSVVRAGMIPQLRTGRLVEAGSNWRSITFTPGRTNPFAAFAAALSETIAEPCHTEIENELRAGNMGALLRDVGKSLSVEPGQETRWLVVVDQFEELFDQGIEPAAARDFVRSLLASVDESNIYVAITLRAERVGDCARFDRLSKAVFGGLYLVPPLEISELRQAIRGPAAIFGFEVAEELVTRLIDDPLRRDRDYLPLMQQTLVRIWEVAWQVCNFDPAAPRVLTLNSYRKASGSDQSDEFDVRKPLGCELDELYAQLCSPSGSSVAAPVPMDIAIERVFRQFVLTPSNERAGAHSVRSMATLGELSQLLEPLTGNGMNAAKAVVDQFRKADFLIPRQTDCPVLKETTEVTLCHEALIRQWPRLAEWARREAADAETFRELLENAKKWGGGRVEVPAPRDTLSNLNRWIEDTPAQAVWVRRYLPPGANSGQSVGNLLKLCRDYVDALKNAAFWEKFRKWFVPGATVALIAGVIVSIVVSRLVEQRIARKTLNATSDAYRSMEMGSWSSAGTRLTFAMNGYMVTHNLAKEDNMRAVREMTSEALRTAMWTEAIAWTLTTPSLEKMADRITTTNGLLPDGSVFAGATAKSFILLSAAGQRRDLPICSAFGRHTGQAHFVTIAYAQSRGFAIADMNYPRACIYSTAEPQSASIAVDLTADTQFDLAPRMSLSSDNKAAAFWSENGHVVVLSSGQTPLQTDYSACRPAGNQRWRLMAVSIANPVNSQPRKIVVFGSTSSPYSADSAHAYLCHVSAEGVTPGSTEVSAAARGMSRVDLGEASILPDTETQTFSPDSRYVVIAYHGGAYVHATDESGVVYGFPHNDDSPVPLPITNITFVAPRERDLLRMLANRRERVDQWALVNEGGNVWMEEGRTQLTRASHVQSLDVGRRFVLEAREDSSARIWDMQSDLPYVEIARLPPFAKLAYTGDVLVVASSPGPEATTNSLALPMAQLPRMSKPTEVVLESWSRKCRIIGRNRDNGRSSASLELSSEACAAGAPDSAALGRFLKLYAVSDDGLSLFGEVPAGPGEQAMFNSLDQPMRWALVDFRKNQHSQGVPAPGGPSTQSISPNSTGITLSGGGTLNRDGTAALAVTTSSVSTAPDHIASTAAAVPAMGSNAQSQTGPLSEIVRVYSWSRKPGVASFTSYAPIEQGSLVRPMSFGFSRTARFLAMGDVEGSIKIMRVEGGKATVAQVAQERLVRQPVRQIGISNEGTAVVVLYTGGTLVLLHCDWAATRCSQSIRTAQMPLREAGRPFTFVGTSEDDLRFQLPVKTTSIKGDERDGVLEIGCATECTADEALLEKRAKERLEVWNTIEHRRQGPPSQRAAPVSASSR